MRGLKETGIRFFVGLFLTSVMSHAYAQDSLDLKSGSLYDMSILELLHVKVETPSKHDQVLFESGMSVSSISADDIIASGATSIPEALRLLPGVIVREQTPGNYDVHIRGLDKILPHTLFNDAVNSITLVMIDERLVYNYFTGGTLWESLPIGIEDLEKIEVVRGPSSVLYGPNAVSGVIHFITKKEEQLGKAPIVQMDVQGGSNNTVISNAFIGQQVNDKLSMSLSFNQDKRDRSFSDYYEFASTSYKTAAEVVSFGNTLIYDEASDTLLARDIVGVNVGAHQRFNTQHSLQLDLGYQSSEAQTIYVDNLATPITFSDSRTRYVNAISKNGSFISQFALLSGEQGSDNALGLNADGRVGYDFRTTDLKTEYVKAFGPLKLTTGAYYRKAVYEADFITGEHELTTLSGAVNLKYQARKFFVKGGVRVDRYNHPGDTYVPYILNGAYHLNEKNMVRLVLSESQRSPTLYDLYLDQSDVIPGFLRSQSSGNLDIDLLSVRMYEVGYRTTLFNRICVDLEGFRNQADNFSDLVSSQSFDSVLVISNQVQNLKAEATQQGVTLNMGYVVSDQLKFRIFGTFQQTEVDDYQPSTDDNFGEPANRDSTVKFTHKATPNVYGGFLLNYQWKPWCRINVNSYFMEGYTFSRLDQEVDISARWILNIKTSFWLRDNLSMYVNARNVLASFRDPSPEFGFGDEIGAVYFVGMRWEM